MRILKALFLFLLIFVYLAFGLLLHFLVTLLRPSLGCRIISHWTKCFSLCVRKILGIRLCLKGKTIYLKENGNFIISNHLSYLDGIILASLFPAIFVSKLQVKTWPLFGWVAQIGGTIFIDRERKLRSVDSIEEIARVLKKQVNILLFPEGTSTNGEKILPFQSLFFEAPLKSYSPIIPVTIQYLKINSQDLSLQNRDKIFWYGQVKFAKHLFSLLKVKKIEAKITIHPKILINPVPDIPDFRKQLSEASRQTILKDFSVVNKDTAP